MLQDPDANVEDLEKDQEESELANRKPLEMDRIQPKGEDILLQLQVVVVFYFFCLSLFLCFSLSPLSVRVRAFAPNLSMIYMHIT